MHNTTIFVLTVVIEELDPNYNFPNITMKREVSLESDSNCHCTNGEISLSA